MKESFVFYKSFYEAINKLPEEYQLELYKAITEYSFEGKIISELSPVAEAMFILMKPNIDSATQRYEASVENGKRGGRPKKENLKKPSNNLDKTQAKPNQNLNDNVDVDDNVDDDTTESTAVDFYLKNINPVASEFELRVIQDYENDMPSDMIIYAMQIAIEQKKPTLAYIKGILRSWKSEGIVCLKQALEETANRKNKEPPKEMANKYFAENDSQYTNLDRFYCNV